MYWEIIIIAAILFIIAFANGAISFNQLVSDNEAFFKKLKEDDWDFYVKARYNGEVNPDILFNKRIKNSILVFGALMLLFIIDFSVIKIVFAIAGGYATFKLSYINMKSFYKKHINEIDQMLPHYLKNIEILIQHYTVPVAIGKSIKDAPEIFRPGLQNLINAINSGDNTINPYMEFAKEYPVRDSMRMMRLLYRLSIGKQDNKQEQLLTFSKSISNLEQKARDNKYKKRLDNMEGMTMKMLVATGIGVMILLILSVLQMINI